MEIKQRTIMTTITERHISDPDFFEWALYQTVADVWRYIENGNGTYITVAVGWNMSYINRPGNSKMSELFGKWLCKEVLDQPGRWKVEFSGNHYGEEEGNIIDILCIPRKLSL